VHAHGQVTLRQGCEQTGDLLGDLRERIETDAAVARENLRIRTALDYSSTGVYLTDPNNTIVYSNRALQQTLVQYQDDVADAA